MVTKTIENPSQILMQMLTGFWVSQSLYVAAKLEISDHLKNGPLPIDLLAEKAKANEAHLYRVLRALASIGFYAESQDKSFELTPLAKLLCSDEPDSMQAVALMLGEQNYTAWGKLYPAVCSGETPFQLAYGTHAYDYFAKNSAAGEVFNTAMAALMRNVHPSVIDAYDFSHFKTIVDVGGGSGMLLAGILRQYQNASGILFELPQVLQEAKQLLREMGLEDRCLVVGGNFFESIVEGGDIYILSHIIHTFKDDDCIQILRNVHQAMPSQGKLLIVEDVLNPNADPSTAKTKFMDVNMLVFTPGGREHTQAEFAELLNSAGFVLTKTIPTASGTYIIEAVKS